MPRALRCAALALVTVTGATAQTPATIPHGSTYFGAAGYDSVIAVARGPGRLVTVVGHSDSDGLATASSLQPFRAGLHDVIVARFDPDLPPGQQLLWCTYLGGSDLEFALDAAVDPQTGLTFVAGLSRSADFPDPTGANPPSRNGPSDGFVAVVGPSGQALVGAVFIGGSGDDRICELEIDPAGTVVVAGVTESWDLPGTSGRAQPSFGGGPSDAFVARVTPFGAGQLIWASYLGGASSEGLPLANLGGNWEGNLDRIGMARDPRSGGIVVATECVTSSGPPPTSPDAPQPSHAGRADIYVAVLDAAGTTLRYATFLGGADVDRPKTIPSHPAGGFVLAGITFSTDLPVSNGCLQPRLQPSPGAPGRDALLAWIDPSRGTTGLRYVTYLGGDAGEDNVLALACESSGLVTAVGYTRGGNFPTTDGALKTAPSPDQTHGFVSRLRLDQGGPTDLAYSSLVGGTAPGTWTRWAAVALDDAGDAWCAGDSNSTAYPLVAPHQPLLGGGNDAVITHLPLLPGGASREDLGSATPACIAPLYAGMHGAPRPGRVNFALTATNAAPGGLGALLLGAPASRPSPILNAFLLVDPLLASGTLQGDGLGHAELVVPVPATLPTGVVVAVQWFFLTNPTCPGSGPLASSERLVFRTF
jgi:hypothetical protein